MDLSEGQAIALAGALIGAVIATLTYSNGPDLQTAIEQAASTVLA